MMKHLRLVPVALAGLFVLSACDTSKLPGMASEKSAEPAVFQQGTVLAIVNGNKITQDLLDAYKESWKSRRRGAKMPDDATLLNELINSELVFQDALDKSLDSAEEVREQLHMQRRSVLIAADLQDFFKVNPVTEEDRKALYEEKIGGQPNKEFKAKHILLKSEEEAKDVIAELDKGADFSKLAKERSTGPSGKQGGELGWFPPARMVPAFSQAVATLEKGSYSKQPVKTQFGWHIILLEDERDTTPPSYEEVADQLNVALRNQRVSELFQKLRAKASIETLDNATTPAPENTGE